MVYESDFYTTRRPYRATPSVSSYTLSSYPYVPSRQIRILPGIGKVHVVHSYDRLIPYIGHKRLTVVSAPPHYYRVRPSVIVREIDRITHKARPYIYYTPSLTHSEPITFFDDEARLIRLQSNSLLRSIHASVPRVHSPWPITTTKVRYHYDYEYPSSLKSARITSPDDYIHRVLTPIRNVYDDIYNVSHYYTTPLKKYLGPMSNLSCVRYSGGKPYSRRRNLTLQEIYAMQSDTVRNDIQMLSYYIRANKDRKAREGNIIKASAQMLDGNRPSRHFSKPTMMLEPSEEIKQLREDRAERMKKIYEIEDKPAAVEDAGAKIKRSTKKQEEERALAEEKARKQEVAKKEQAKKEEEARRAELARQEALAAQAAAERQAEIERKAELARQEELAKKAEEERKAEKAAEEARIAAEKAEQARVEEEKRQAELAKQEEERQQLLRLEEIARQAEEEKENELARQAEELAELARQETELAEQARKDAELAELAKQEAELAELERQEKELAELDKQERELAEAAKQESELEDQAKEDAELAAAESNIPTEGESSSGPEPTASEDEAIASEPEHAVETDVTGSETEPEPVIEEPETPDAEE